MEPEQMTQAMTVAANLWPRGRWPSTPDEARLARDIWMRQLGDFHEDVVLAAIDWLAAEGDEGWPPAPGQIARRCRELVARDPLVPGVDQALAELATALSRHGRTGSPEWSHPAIADAVKSIGWSNLCNSTPDMLRAHFLKVYAVVAGRARRIESMPSSVRDVLARVAVGELGGGD